MGNFNLTSYAVNKKEFMAYMKNYLKKIVENMKSNGKTDDDVKFFQGKVQEFVKRIVGDFDNWEFYQGSKEDDEAGLVFSYWEDESAAGPMFYYIRAGYKEVKC